MIAHDPTHVDVTKAAERIGLCSARDHDARIKLACTPEQSSGGHSHGGVRRRVDQRSERPVVIERQHDIRRREHLKQIVIGSAEQVGHSLVNLGTHTSRCAPTRSSGISAVHRARARPRSLSLSNQSSVASGETDASYIMAQLLVGEQTICSRRARRGPSCGLFAGDCSLTPGTPRASLDAWAFRSTRAQAPSRRSAASMIGGASNRVHRCPRSRIWTAASSSTSPSSLPDRAPRPVCFPNQKYTLALEIRLESVPDLCQQFSLTFPAL